MLMYTYVRTISIILYHHAKTYNTGEIPSTSSLYTGTVASLCKHHEICSRQYMYFIRICGVVGSLGDVDALGACLWYLHALGH